MAHTHNPVDDARGNAKASVTNMDEPNTKDVENAGAETSVCSLPEPDWQPQFSLRSLLVLTFAVAVWLSICRMVPHVAVFLLGIILVAVTTYALIRLKKKVRGCRLRRLDRCAFTVLWTLTVLSWAFFYVVSIGPVVAIAHKTEMGDPRALKTFYTPVVWLHDYTPLAKPIEAYSNGWGWR